MALLLRLKTTRPKSQPLHHLFSTTGGDGSGDDNNPSFADSLKDLRSSLKRQPTSNQPSSTLFSSNSSQSESVSDLMSKIQSFRNRTAAPVSEGPSSPQQISFQEIYSKMQNRSGAKTSSEGSNHGTTTGGGGTGGGSSLGLDAIRGSLMKLRNTNQVQTPKFRPSSPVINGTGSLPDKIFGEANSKNLDFVRLYMHDELGEKLKKLRPQVKGKDWFSIAELNERLKKVREMDEIEASSDTNDNNKNKFWNIKNAIANMKPKGSETPKIPLQRVDFLSIMNGTPTYLTKPPKEHLVEKYFHPDNMSSAEKLKIELTKVRDEFKMSESDCGSSRVQVAILTTKIKHLSSVLHKKDVHSRKGLIAMVQKRKKLLKYLRRTDWDSYCFVISKLGLRDNPEHTYRARTGKSGDVAN
ncbi:S15/NS1, RNA-binding protein [Trifolium repens]|nr:S15/NS1, RNA-binding protein [Trifolium repens]